MAEPALAAASERVGVATADLFPRVTFSGFVGFLSGDSSQLGKAASRAWINPAVSWLALDFGSAHARLRAPTRRPTALCRRIKKRCLRH